MTDLSVPLTKGSSGITVLSQDELSDGEPTTCIRCGKCLDVCPLGLAPTKIAHAAKFEDYELAKRYDLTACCDCGCCAYVCPAHIPLVHYIRMGKTALMRQKNKA
jgi:electron transport complex protein RnfC